MLDTCTMVFSYVLVINHQTIFQEEVTGIHVLCQCYVLKEYFFKYTDTHPLLGQMSAADILIVHPTKKNFFIRSTEVAQEKVYFTDQSSNGSAIYINGSQKLCYLFSSLITENKQVEQQWLATI